MSELAELHIYDIYTPTPSAQLQVSGPGIPRQLVALKPGRQQNPDCPAFLFGKSQAAA